MEQLLVELGTGYVDFYEYGIDESIMSKSGLQENKFDDQTIVPNYFEPFEKINSKLSWALKSNSPTVTPIVKESGDQDRRSGSGKSIHKDSAYEKYPQ